MDIANAGPNGRELVNDLAGPFEMSQAAISRHLEVLERAGLISSASDAQRRPRKLEARPLAEAAAWLVEFRRFWETSFLRLDGCLDELQGMQVERRRAPARRHPRLRAPGRRRP